MFETYKVIRMDGRDLWKDFITAFRDHTIMSWQRSRVTAYWDLLKARGVHVGGGRGKNKKEELIKLLHREKHIGTSELLLHPEEDDNLPLEKVMTLPEKEGMPIEYMTQRKPTRKTQEPIIPYQGEDPQSYGTRDEWNPDDSPSSSSSSTRDEDGVWEKPTFSSGRNAEKKKNSKRGDTETPNYQTGKQDYPRSTGMGVKAIMKAYIGQSQFTGA